MTKISATSGHVCLTALPALVAWAATMGSGADIRAGEIDTAKQASLGRGCRSYLAVFVHAETSNRGSKIWVDPGARRLGTSVLATFSCCASIDTVSGNRPSR
ncbi:hypothetical protein GGS23DRAFT_385348 [Durotheca rogersii]|uniref:uncharacterized protein n=1 Tax=Durotheca rogersii TaxID=419775 RepID=UPI00221F3102|nr:uncharacterized protein GGS23DRAFT_385348 [Durotheca rogersii]KAI5857296.1 hypothetical protein GGS23DRAFT_385348 [Durotheca rogersii]